MYETGLSVLQYCSHVQYMIGNCEGLLDRAAKRDVLQLLVMTK